LACGRPFSVVALVRDFPSVLLGVRESDEDPYLVDPETWSADRRFGADGPLVGGTMARGSASMTSNAMSYSNSSVRERASIGELGRQMIWLFFDGGAIARCWW